jgi:alkylation response protein AidB-like acyl-CoA dehydrogenase
MDFALSEDQQAVSDLARRIFKDHCATETVAAAEDGWFHEALWRDLGKAELLGLGLPEAAGGGGLGFTAQCLLLEQVGWNVAPIPLWPSLLLGALPIARFGDASTLRDVASGARILTGAFAPGPVEARESDGWRLHGVRGFVPAAHLAESVVVPAGDGVFVARLADVEVAAQTGTNGEPLGQLTFDGTPAVRLGDASEVLPYIEARAQVGLCAILLGIASRALRLTAAYTTERRQFDRPIATFQAVTQRVGDMYVDVESMRLTTWRAAWLLDHDQDAEREVAVARIYAADCGHRVVNAAQHLHAGIGFDRDYPLHRYFLWAKHLEFTLGSAKQHVARLGALIAAPSPHEL